MSKKKKQVVLTEKKPVEANVIHYVPAMVKSKDFITRCTSGFVPYIILMIGSVLLYANTFHHQYALDDEIVICQNEYVLQGMSGMSDIFNKDLFDSYYKQMNTKAQLSGGRFRPLSVATFAIEQEIIGTKENATYTPNCWDKNNNNIQDKTEDINKDGNYNEKDCKSEGFGLRHINNVLLYGLCVCMLFLFLSTVIFPTNKGLCFIISLLFMAHPIHTEVVANVKSRDEILSLFFMLLTLFFVHKQTLYNSFRWTLLACISFFAAMLSKEYGVVLLLIIPLSNYLFSENWKQKKLLVLYISIVVTFIIYYYMRTRIGEGSAVLQDMELLNNPYMLATATQKLATEIFIFLNYFYILLFPYTLCSDYGYNVIHYKSFSDIEVWLSILVLITIAVVGIKALVKKHWAAFALAFYMLTLLLVTNLFFNIGATMGERLAFHSSVGFCMLLGYGLYYLSSTITANKMIVWALLIPILILYSLKTISRNRAWENDITLALTDINIHPESISLNGNASARYIDMSEYPSNKDNQVEFLNKAKTYSLQAIKVHPTFLNAYLNLGIVYAKLRQLDSAKYVWNVGKKIYPHHPTIPKYFSLLANAYQAKAYELGKANKWAEGIIALQSAIECEPNSARLQYDLGGFLYSSGKQPEALNVWRKAFAAFPNDSMLQHINAQFH